jgi:excisionase family DNA binding protein
VERLEVLRGGRDGLLSVREAAEQLGLCTATVYGLCAEGALPHIRILNAIRIAPADLVDFLESRRVCTRVHRPPVDEGSEADDEPQ